MWLETKGIGGGIDYFLDMGQPVDFMFQNAPTCRLYVSVKLTKGLHARCLLGGRGGAIMLPMGLGAHGHEIRATKSFRCPEGAVTTAGEEGLPVPLSLVAVSCKE